MPIFILVLPSRTTMKISARLPLVLIYLCFVAAIGVSNSVHAGSSTWGLNPASGDWNTATNWTPATVPNGVGRYGDVRGLEYDGHFYFGEYDSGRDHFRSGC